MERAEDTDDPEAGAMAPELEVLDQVLGGDLSLDLIAGLFLEPARCRIAVDAMLRAGDVTLLDASGETLPTWTFRKLQHDPAIWVQGTPYRLSITEVGAGRIT
jgi:hypothetical protein